MHCVQGKSWAGGMRAVSTPAAGPDSSARKATAAATCSSARHRPCVARKFKENDNMETDRPARDVQKLVERDLKVAKDEVESTLEQTSQPATVEGLAKIGLLTPAFTRQREVMVGRVAMVGIAAAGFWEWFVPSHPNILLQISNAFSFTGINVGAGGALEVVLAIVTYNTLVSLSASSITFTDANMQDVARRPVGPPAHPVNPLNYKQFFGVTGWGFTKANELFNGRLAMLGFAAALIQQMRLGGLTGPGPLAQVAHFLGFPANDVFYASIPGIPFVAGFALFAASFAFYRGQSGENAQLDEDDIY